jgi:hypothetical protein
LFDRVRQTLLAGLLALDLVHQDRVLLLQLPQSPNVGAICRADQMREHVNVAECLLHKPFGGQRVGQNRPIRTGDIALLQRFGP